MDKLNPPATSNEMSYDEIYFKIWKKQQDWAGARWNIITVFLSISFALFGLSFQRETLPIPGKIQRLGGLVIYWFAFCLFYRYGDWSKFLRKYLEDLEREKLTKIDLHLRWKKTMETSFRKRTTMNKLLLYFGLLYTIIVVALWFSNF